MKKIIAASLLCLGMAVHSSKAASQAVGQVGRGAVQGQPRIIDMGAHYKVVEFEDAMGRKVSCTELETGMNYRETERGPWLPSREEIIITPKGDAAAPYGPNKVMFAANLNSEGAIQLTTQEGKLLRSHVLGLAYVDEESGQSLLIAELRDTFAVLEKSNVLIYEDAFDGVQADVRYTWRKNGFEQDIILRSKPLPPEAYGLNPETTRLTVWTEFLEAPVPKTKQVVLHEARQIGRSYVSEVIDDTVEFGATRIGAGKAFPIENREDSEPVAKSWIKSEGRQFLMEQVLWPVLESKIESLPDYVGIDRANPFKRQFAGNVPPKRSFIASAQTNDLRRVVALVEARSPRAGFVIDYDLQSTHADFYFAPGGTYVVNGFVALSGTTRLGGGVVVKYAPGGKLKLSGILQCETSPWWPAVFTGKNDNTVGIVTSSSSALFYASIAIQAEQLVGDLHDVKIRQADTAIDWASASGRISNLQVVDCNQAVDLWMRCPGGAPVKIHNMLAVNVGNMLGGNGLEIDGQHWTLANVSYMQSNDGTPIELALINCIFSGVGDLQGVTQLNCQTVGSGAFSPVGFGGYYLPSNSALINQGTPNIDPILASELRRMSVLPPQMLTGTLPAISVLGKVALLDTGAPDPGYHYAPLDYVVRSATIPAGGTLILTNGAAMGVDYNGASWGLNFGTGAKFISQGSPLNMNRFVAAQVSQERGGIKPGTRAFIHDGPSSSMTDELRFRFTELTQLADDGYLLYVGTKFSKIEWSHSKNKGVWLTLSQAPGQEMGLTNNLWIRGYNHFTGANGSEIHLRNNTIRDGNWYFNSAQSAWTARDNLFDSMLNLSTTGSSWTSSHNAYWNSTALPGATSTLTLTSLAYDAGLLGNFYLTPNSPLINAGSRTADQAGLYHYTTQVGQAKEVGSTVDIGFHYVPVASYLASDGFSGSLGQSPWSYRYTDTRKGLPAGLMNEYLVGNGWWHIWEDTYCLVAADIQHPGSTHDSVRTFQSPFSGRVLITGNLRNFDPGEAICGDGIEYRLLRNTDTLKDWQTVYRSATWIPVSVETEVQAGDLLQSQISAVTWDNNCDSAQWNPLIIYPDLLSDEDADGIPDYMEDRNGNGIVDTGETNPSLADSDFDGVNDGDELTDGTDPLNAASTTHRSLASFSFNGADWIGDQGQIPLNTRGLATGEPGMEGQAVSIVGAPWSKILNYRTVEPDGKPNLAFAAGTVAFWFKPNWTCATLGGWGPDPGAWGRLFNLGEWSQSATYGFWDVGLNPDGTQISQGVQDGLGNSGGTPWGYINVSFDNWVHIAVTYSPTYSAVYVNGVQVSGAAWGSLIPPKAVRDKGFFIGSDTAGHQQAQGSYDLLKTYNYPMSAEEVRALFVSENKNLVTDPTVEKANQISLQSPWVKVPGTAGGNWFHNNQTLTCNSHPWCLSSEGYQKIGVVQSDTRYTLKFDLYQATTYAGAMLASEVYLAVGPSRTKVGDAVPINCGVAGSTQTRNWTTYTVSYKSSGSNSVHWAQDLYLVFKATVSGGGTDQTTTQPILAQTALDNFVLQKAPGNLIDRGDFAGFADYANTGDNAMIAPWQGTGGWNGTSGGSKGIYPYAGVGILDVYSYANTAEAWQKIGKLEADTLYHAYMDQMVHVYATNVTIKGKIYFAVGSSRTPIDTVWEKALTNPQQPAMSGMNLAFRSPAPGDSLLGQDLYLVVRCEGTGDMAYSNGGYFKGRVVIDNVVATKTPATSSDADTDGDGLSNSDELARGTDPFQKDTDYDGVNDGEEVALGLDPKNPASTKNRPLASFNFSEAGFLGDQGQVPNYSYGAQLVAGIVGNGYGIGPDSEGLWKGVSYRDVEANGVANINCRQGTISFWFKPNWSSVGLPGGTGVQNWTRLLELGAYSADARYGQWCLGLNPDGTTITLSAQADGVGETFLSCSVQFTAGQWHHLAVAYGPTSSAIYLNGLKLGADGTGVGRWPSPAIRANGFKIGWDGHGGQKANGTFDLLATYNSPMSGLEVQLKIAADIVQLLQDSDNDGLSDDWEFRNFGNLAQGPDEDYDNDGISNANEFANGLDPNDIKFALETGAQISNIREFAITTRTLRGKVAEYAVLVRDISEIGVAGIQLDYDAAVWKPIPDTSSTQNEQVELLAVALPETDGNYQVFVGERGLGNKDKPVWKAFNRILDTVPPVVTLHEKGAQEDDWVFDGVVPQVAVIASSTEGIAKVECFVGTEVVGNVLPLRNSIPSGAGGSTGAEIEISEIPVGPGVNQLRLVFTDWAGNTTEVEQEVYYSAQTASGGLVVSWPPQNASLAGSTFTVSGSAPVGWNITVACDEVTEALPARRSDGYFYVNDIPIPQDISTITVKAFDRSGRIVDVAHVPVSKSTIYYDLFVSRSQTDKLHLPANYDEETYLDVSIYSAAESEFGAVSFNGVSATWDSDNSQWNATRILPNSDGKPLVTMSVSGTPEIGSWNGLVQWSEYYRAEQVYSYPYWISIEEWSLRYENKSRDTDGSLLDSEKFNGNWLRKSGGSFDFDNYSKDGWFPFPDSFSIITASEYGGVYDSNNELIDNAYVNVTPPLEIAVDPSESSLVNLGIHFYLWPHDGHGPFLPQGAAHANYSFVSDDGSFRRDVSGHTSWRYETSGIRGGRPATVQKWLIQAYDLGKSEGVSLDPSTGLFSSPTYAELSSVYVDPVTMETKVPFRFQIKKFGTFSRYGPSPAINSSYYNVSMSPQEVVVDMQGDANGNGWPGDGDLDDIPEDWESHGVVVRVNDNDDDGDGVPDYMDAVVNCGQGGYDCWSDLQDMQQILLKWVDAPAPYGLRLRLDARGVNAFRVFSGPNMYADPADSVPILGPGSSTLTIPREAVSAGAHGLSIERLNQDPFHSPYNVSIYVEALKPNAKATLYYDLMDPEGHVVDSDVIVLRSSTFDLDIDSDNNNGFEGPDRSNEEDLTEDAFGVSGKIVPVNSDDIDGDGVADMGDGFNADGIAGNDDDANTPEYPEKNNQFVPLVLEVQPTGIDVEHARVRITYDSPADPGLWPSAVGGLRLWTKNADKARNKATAKTATTAGDYVEPGIYELSWLGWKTHSPTVSLYVEGITASAAVGDRRIIAELDPDGDGPAGWTRIDAVKLTCVDMAINSLDRYVEVRIPESYVDAMGGVARVGLEFHRPANTGGAAETYRLNKIDDTFLHQPRSPVSYFLQDGNGNIYNNPSVQDGVCLSNQELDSTDPKYKTAVTVSKEGGVYRFITVLNTAGPIKVRLLKDQQTAFEMDYLLRPHADMSELINQLDRIFTGDPYPMPSSFAVSSDIRPFFWGRILGEANRHLIAKCCSAVFEKVESAVKEGVAIYVDGVKTAVLGAQGFVEGFWVGVKSDAQGVAEFAQMLTKPVETAKALYEGFRGLLSMSLSELKAIPKKMLEDYLTQAQKSIAWADPSGADLVFYSVGYAAGYVTEQILVSTLTAGAFKAAVVFGQTVKLGTKVAAMMKTVKIGESLLKGVKAGQEGIAAVQKAKNFAVKAASQYVKEKSGFNKVRSLVEETLFKACLMP